MGINSTAESLGMPVAMAGIAPNGAAGVMTLEKFAEVVGLPPGVVLGHLNRGIIPSVTLGRRRLVNLVALQRELGRKEFAL